MSDKNKDNLHISEQSQSKFQRIALTDAENIGFLEQMLKSEEDLNEYIDELTSSVLDPMPVYLEEEVLTSIHMKVQSQTEEHLHSIWLPLLGYSVKIGFAAACAILMLFHLPDISLSTDRTFQDRIPALTQDRENDREESWETAWDKSGEETEKKRKRTAYTAAAFEFITSKIFDGGIEND